MPLHDDMKAHFSFQLHLGWKVAKSEAVFWLQPCLESYLLYFTMRSMMMTNRASLIDFLRGSTDGSLLNFKVAWLRAKTKIVVCEILPADDDAFAFHNRADFQLPMDRAADAWDLFSGHQQQNDHCNVPVEVLWYVPDRLQGLVSQKSTAVIGSRQPLQGLVSQKSTAAAACSFYVQRRLSWEGNPVQNRESSQHLHSTLSSNAWKNYPHYTAHQRQHSRSLHSSLFYGCGTWPTYMRQKRKLNSGHMRSAQCSRRHLDKIKNEVILQLNGCIAPCLVN